MRAEGQRQTSRDTPSAVGESRALATHAGQIETEAAGAALARGPNLAGSRARFHAEATRGLEAAPTVEDVLEHGYGLAGVSPSHLAIRGTPAASSVRCAWRGVARTNQQREDTIRFWLRLGATDPVPASAYVEALFAVTFDTLDPAYRETAKANFLSIARGGESREYLFLTCFADYAVTAFLLGSGTTPTTVTVAYDGRGEAAAYALYVREHEAGTYGSDPLQSRGAYEAALQAQVVAAEKALSNEIGGREAVVIPRPHGRAPRHRVRGLAGGGVVGGGDRRQQCGTGD